MSGKIDAIDLIIGLLKEHEKELDRIEDELKKDVEALTEVVGELLEEIRFFRVPAGK